MGLVDAVIYSAPQGLTAFSNADGINALVGIVKVSLLMLSNADDRVRSKSY